MLNNRTINKSIPIPLYFQLRNILLEYISKDHHNQETPIPTEVNISSHFGISRPTVRQAINSLVADGYLYRIKGRGTFISKPKTSQDFVQALESYDSEMSKKGLTPSIRLLEREVTLCDDRVAKALKLGKDSRVVKLSRLRYAHDGPVVFVVSYLPYDRCRNLLNRNLETESIYKILECEYNLKLERVVRSLESVPAGAFEAGLLDMEKGSPVQYIESIVYLSDDTPIEFSIAKYRGDRNKFTFELKRHI